MCPTLPHDSSSKVNLFVHSEYFHSNFSSTIKLLLRNDSSSTVKIEPGTSIVQALILPILHPTLIHESSVQSYSTELDDRTDQDMNSGTQDEELSHSSLLTSEQQSAGSSIALSNFELCSLPPSYIHMMTEEKIPSCVNSMEINTNIILPDAEENRLSIFPDLKQMESQNDQNIRKDHLTPISFPNPNSEKLIQDLNRDLMDKIVYLHSTVSTLQKDSEIKESLAESIRDSAYQKMCVRN